MAIPVAPLLNKLQHPNKPHHNKVLIVKLYTLLLSASLLTLLSGCTSTTLTNPNSTSCITEECEIRNKALVLQIYTHVMNRGQFNLIQHLFDTNLIIQFAGVNGSITEEAHIQTLKTNTPSYTATVKHIAADGDYVAVHWHLSTNVADEFNGKAVVDLYRLSGNKIVEHWHLSSNLTATSVSSNSLFSNLYDYAGTKPQATKISETDNKTLVTSVYLDLFNNKKSELIDQYFIPDYIQHNPFVPNGREALRSFVNSMPPRHLSFFCTLADDDLVWTFSGDNNLTLVDIFRVDDKKIVEHYDLF